MKEAILLRRTPLLRAVAIAGGCYGPAPARLGAGDQLGANSRQGTGAPAAGAPQR